MSDKTATVRPARLLYLNVCVQSQFSHCAQRQQGEKRLARCRPPPLTQQYGKRFTQQLKILPGRMIARIKCTDYTGLSDSYRSFLPLLL